MDHWSKTSTVEPLPVGKHRKREKDVDSGLLRDFHSRGKLQNTVTVYPVARAPRAVSMRSIDAEINNVEGKKYGMQVISRVEKAPFCTDLNSNSGLGSKNGNELIQAPKRVQSILSDFRAFCDHLFEEHQSKRDGKKNESKRVDCIAARMIKRKYGYPGTGFLGSIAGVEVGDRFHYRMELHVLGLHRPPQGGIDSMYNGRRWIAISVVDSGGYDNYMSNQETLIYCGEGGNSRGKSDHQECSAEVQKLKRGNRALMNSIKEKNPVRVIRGSKVHNNLSFIYDGLYTVEKLWENNLNRKFMLKFKLVRLPGQPSPFLARRN